MIVRCPDCASRYRVREEKLPPGGGNIQCPSCGTIFPTMPPAQRGAAPATVQAVSPPVAHSQSAPAVLTAPATQPTAASPASGGGPGPGAGGGAQTSGNWKLKTPVGLVYDFPHIEALRNWLATRESFDGMLASRDAGKSWNPISHWPELTEALPKGRPAGMTAAAPPARRQPSSDYARAGTPVGSVDAVNRLAGQRPQATPAKRDQAAKRTAAARPARDPRANAPARPQRPGAPRRPDARGGAARPTREPGSRVGAYAGIALGVLIVLAGILQATGTIDVVDSLGLGGENPNAPPLYPEPPPERFAQAQQPTAVSTQVPGQTTEFRSSENWDTFNPNGASNPNQLPPGPDPFQGRSAVELAQAGMDPHQQRIVGLIQESETAAAAGNYQGAISLLSSASQLDRNNPEIICRLASFHRAAGNYAESDALQSQCESLRQEARAP
jgi:predicted Zn finger-like uncharacterized protein